MKKSTKQLENYYLDRTYQNHAGRGTIIIKKKAEEEIMHDVIVTAKDEIGQCFNHALLSFRKTRKGYIVVVTRQPETTEIAYNLAKQLQSEMREELKANNYFVDNYDGFAKWFAEKEKVLKDNGFHKLKG